MESLGYGRKAQMPKTYAEGLDLKVRVCRTFQNPPWREEAQQRWLAQQEAEVTELSREDVFFLIELGVICMAL